MQNSLARYPRSCCQCVHADACQVSSGGVLAVINIGAWEICCLVLKYYKLHNLLINIATCAPFQSWKKLYFVNYLVVCFLDQYLSFACQTKWKYKMAC